MDQIQRVELGRLTRSSGADWHAVIGSFALLVFLLTVELTAGDGTGQSSGQTPSSLGGVKTAAEHWAFQPLRPVPVPRPPSEAEVRTPIDAFILDALARKGLRQNSRAAARDLIRRASYDLTGLPPTPEQIQNFAHDTRSDAWERLVDDLLRSPRYGERWAQFWLDVVRYADTHGFEVNTERPNAWPYRDYVIAAFNADLPYDRFIREQLVGDKYQADAATGFLVTPAVLLPGQIGADDVSKRLARQDELSEMISGTGQALLGLSLGCARCHDHKFDPIPQADYYSLQAFFSGVQFGDRPIRTPESEARQREASDLKRQVGELEKALARFEPLAQLTPAPPRERINSRSNEVRFAATEARFVRFTIHGANLHPTLGLIEPCLDEFEVFTEGAEARNVALAASGAKITASGSRVSENHRLEFINDGRYGNSRSWMSDEMGRGWILLELPQPTRISRIVWGRDREGKLSDRTPTAFTLEVGASLDGMTTLSSVAPLRVPVNPRQTTDRFAPLTTQKLRFTITDTTSLEPCLDELEVFSVDPSPRNVALASAGSTLRASGSLPNAAIHQLEHLNDGRYGNSFSWISHEVGRGWVEVQFARPETIDRVIWGRDREGKFADRLATNYLIEVELPSGTWRPVAGSMDRRAYSPDDKSQPSFTVAGLPANDAREAGKLLAAKRALDAKIKELLAVPMVYAGTFTTPEPTRVLYRGDPEQPRAPTVPAIPAALGSVKLPADTSEQERRSALAAWIASPANPLTARVMVNRVWQGHFGLGLVETANDFGHNGTRPSHPELLDWLAGEFIRSGWSVKHLHRLILNSATYRQSSRINAANQAADADNRLLWRFPARRLEAECIRDSMLAVSGRLDLKMGGPGFNLFRSRGGLDGFPPIESFSGEGLRRMIYSHKVRMEREGVFGAFDCPDAGQSMPRRRQSTTPIQALNLFNSRFTIEEAEAFANRIKRTIPETSASAELIRCAYELALGRPPLAEELAETEPLVREHGLPLLCRVLYNSSEFLFIP